MARKKSRKRRGHWCWCCDRVRANESFSGRGYNRHLCRDCQRLGREELAIRREESNLLGRTTFEGIIGRKHLRHVRSCLHHAQPRIRELAQALLLTDARARRELSDEWEAYALRKEEDAWEAKLREIGYENTWLENDGAGGRRPLIEKVEASSHPCEYAEFAYDDPY